MKLRMDEQIAAGALGASVLVSDDFSQNVDRSYWLISGDFTMTRRGFTDTEGPIIFGVADGDYLAAEVEEWLEASNSWDTKDRIAAEQANRKCRIIGTMHEPQSEQPWNDGRPKRVKLGWEVFVGSTLGMWIYNDGGATLTTGGILEYHGVVYARPN